MQPTLLIVDDDTSNLASLVKIFERLALRVLPATHGEEALKVLRAHSVEVILTDLMMPKVNGVDLLKHAKALSPDTEVVMMTAYGTIERAVEAMRAGAYDFITKPFRRAEVERVVKRALEKTALLAENRALKAQLADAQRINPPRVPWGIIGNAPVLRRVLELTQQAAPSDATVLLSGESGTGKELFARALHGMSLRAEGPFVAVNCGALPDTIIEAELFGAEKGAYTGAHSTRDGRFSRADGGTLFLDEISELSPHVQVRLLRVLQSGEYERVGGTRALHSDCRVVAASNRDLRQMVQSGELREDLYYRLNVIQITLPPLRSRPDDVPLLADHFLRFYAEKNRKVFEGISPKALRRLVDYPWPGNVRELENTLERAVVLSRGAVIVEEDLPETVLGGGGARDVLTVQLGTPLEEIERRVIRETLRFTDGDKNRAAQLLGIAKRTIYRKLE
ncbi:sigma-54 dependent transcriptional regulator [Myxococcota bacterium]|nr:sigma-54 dependent transcriptional regulator [Myxococcota bacterium]MBU1431459.1 sigma-54 dependent transcriptional regulator [Myxococcota bacterium]MBU1898549.1 sigma-54 dependent transcriptional regulator [Myxococcota bacterium]